MRSGLVDAVLERLGLDRPSPDRACLGAVYAAWCAAVPFDNVLKLTHVRAGLAGPLPGSTRDDFFDAWLEHGVGGTCWAGNGALYELLAALGFETSRVIATMLPSPDVVGPNHGSVVVALGGERWIVDASILSGEPIRIPEPSEPAGAGPLPRFEWLDGSPSVVWRTPNAPDGFPCRFDRVGADDAECDALHRRTAEWSPFNYELNVRLLRGGTSIGIASGQRFEIDGDGSVSNSILDRAARVQFLVEEVGISEELARRVPDDLPVPPRPKGR
jgi:N-hydroxyarylamine O-acetyltransferase